MEDDYIDALIDGSEAWLDDPEDPDVQWRVRVEGDDISAFETINDCDVWGKLEYTHDGAWGSQRPAGFGPHSRVVNLNGLPTWGQHLWWEPYDWREDRKDRNFESEFAEVKRLLEEGFASCGVQRRVRCHCCQSWKQQNSAWLGSIAVWPWQDEHHEYRQIVSDLFYEIETELEQEKDA